MSSNQICVLKQAKLEGQQKALKLRLKQALRLAKAPCTHVDTLTVADKAIALLDKMLEVDMMLRLDCLKHIHCVGDGRKAFMSLACRAADYSWKS